MKNISIVFLVCCITITACGGGGGGGTNDSAPPPATPPTSPPEVGESAARSWSNLLLGAIRNDFARPTVHARNLFHISAAMYDAWAAYATIESPYLLGQTVDGFNCPLNTFTQPADIETARSDAISFAAYRIIEHRFANSPGFDDTGAALMSLMDDLSLDTSNDSMAYEGGSAAALGNYIADCYIRFGLQDRSNEQNDYKNQVYQPTNPPLAPREPGNRDIVDMNLWQPLSLTRFIDQSGNETAEAPEFLSAEWGQVSSFALAESDRTIYQRDGFDYHVFYDPGAPPGYQGSEAEYYKWGFSLVSIWGSHHHVDDGVMIDISPASIGNVQSYPTTLAEYEQFYNYTDGGDSGLGRATNPITGQPYEQQLVPRGDYSRVLAEFWADGPDSETPPGHWFVIMNEVFDHPDFEFQLQGQGPQVDLTEWYVKSYFALGGAMHDAAIAAWGIKGWYDYIRPISAIRAMGDLGQSSDPALLNYDPDGLPLVPGYIEQVVANEALAGDANQNVGKLKLYSWKGPKFISNELSDTAGVDWILAEEWWSYQRSTFVTPPFAGYISGHSTYSRAAAEVLTALTGSEFFPGGRSGFEAEANEFLVFEDGPSVDLTLQWATYRDASDQCSLSRIWGGIHPPVDDIPGRIIGEQVGIQAFDRALEYFSGAI